MALGEVGQAVSSTLDLETVLQTICVRAAQLAGTRTCTVYEYDEQAEEFHLRAAHHVDERVLAVHHRREAALDASVGRRIVETLLAVDGQVQPDLRARQCDVGEPLILGLGFVGTGSDRQLVEY